MSTVHPGSMTPHQVELLDHALRELAKFSRSGWDGIPAELHYSFAKYMVKDCWTGESDLLDLRHAALMIVRDAIARTGEFADDES
jgi:hypothetical protein